MYDEALAAVSHVLDRAASTPHIVRDMSAKSPERHSSAAVEDYLERILELINTKGYARVVDIAQSLKISQASVTNMVQRLDAEGFRAGRAALDLSLGLALTLSLLTAGFLAAAAVELVRRGHQRRAGFLLLAALALGLLHVWLKAGEYLHLAQRGLDLEHSTFFTLFWLVTGFHFLHVWLGLVILGWMALRCLRGAYAQGALGGLESGALYWHMVDLVWVMLFPLVYVLAPLP